MPSFPIQAVEKIRLIARVRITRAMVCLSRFKEIIKPISLNEDDRRREYILNIILVLSLIALCILGTTLIWNAVHVEGYAGMNPVFFTLIIILYATLLYLSKKGYWKISSNYLLIINAVGTIYTGWKWGASLPETLLLTVLVIVIANVLINSTAGFITAGIMIGSLAILGIHEAIRLNVPDWRLDEISVTDVITYSVMFLFISFIAWLSNREIDASLQRARRSEKLLQVERDTLEQRVSERTEQLIVNQEKRLSEIEHVVKVGELAQGVIHDMMSPLSSMSLYMEEVSTNSEKYSTDAIQEMIKKTLSASQRMKSFMESARHHICPTKTDDYSTADIYKEIIIARDILAYSARRSHVHIDIHVEEPIMVLAHPLRIHQILINILSNAIDACSQDKSEQDFSTERCVCVDAEAVSGSARITVSDNGCGMDELQTQRLFTHPKTTKSGGTGIGLMNTYSIVKNELGGSLDVKSKKGFGTSITITIPISERSNQTNQK
ncbi:MAG: HAMP domain-containing sensor histidine kinase [Candidatus Pacebacteria bacterium]|nr:HAMP domain-containing sensor histidine kinase [Candidatus Paceibacterota bacterium]